MFCTSSAHLSTVGSILARAVIWIGALAGSYLAWRTLDRIGRTTSIVAALIGFVVVYVLMVTVAFGTAWLIPLFCLLGVVTWWGAAACWPLPSELAPTEVRGRAQGLGSGLQRVSIGVNVLLVSHMLAWVGFRATVLLAAGISVAFIPLALWGRRFEPSRKSLELASGDQVLAPAIVGPPGPRRGCRGVHSRQPVGRRERFVGDVAHRERDRAEDLGFGAELAERHRVVARCGGDPPLERAADAVQQRRAGRRELAADDHELGVEHAARGREDAPDRLAGVGDQPCRARVAIVRQAISSSTVMCGPWICRSAAVSAAPPATVARHPRLPQRQICPSGSTTM